MAENDEKGFQGAICPSWAPCIGFMGCVAALFLSNAGAAYGTAKAAQGIMTMGVRSPGMLIKNSIPIVMAGVLGIYGLIVTIILNGKITLPESSSKEDNVVGVGIPTYSQYNAYAHAAAGLCCGLASLASGIAIGISADAGVRAIGAQSSMSASWKKMGFSSDASRQMTSTSSNIGGGDSLFVGIVLIQVFASNLGLYGLIAALILSQANYTCEDGD
mmetsp:Transcript_27130/g.30955  ORF Transcript_27130/g.30955 Transcript_27130/m.30955 type:complete len:217 (-) Transcript_27130:194-844(-)|eukprot:CAMPEP_0194150916 /NCGR_PEP_ID=MMETSP0152-20130528/45745_1 /TAXON_ID=1049557 /ORGANISM="Thalassiothrix antarctica, Strain L6-D1" /LENGTH=216 /DNA_ID=CAMNT_0038854261 /DNA_START=106 /DNA_END=756 /DNA_ORIENTATION=-